MNSRLFGSTDILLFYNLLPTKKLTLKPNNQRRDCNCLEVELMDEAVIRKVKEIVIKRKISENEGEGRDLEEKFEDMKEKMELKISSLESKIDLLLSRS